MHPATWCLLLAALLLWPATEGSVHAADDAPYQVGVARVDVTPDYPIRLNGFGSRREPSEGVTQRIWAKALAIQSGDQPPLVLIALDSLGVRLPMVDEVARRLHDKTGLPRERLVVTFTHSHTAPKVNGASDNIFSQPIPAEHQRNIDRYTRELTDYLEQVALAALADRRPSSLAWSVGTVGFAKNRRTAGGPVDHDLPMLVVRDNDGTVRAIYVSYACHCVTLSHNMISGDWAGYAQEMIERRFPNATALVSIGAGSDSNPTSGVVGDRVDIATEQGTQIADEVARLIREPLEPLQGEIACRLQRIDLPLQEHPTRAQWQAMIEKGGPAGYNAQTQLARLDRGEPLLAAIDYPIQTVTFGDRLHMVFLAGEVCVDYALRLKRELDRHRLWIHGYSNDFCAYIPSERLLQEGGYGGGGEIPYFALPTTLRPGLEQRIIDQVRRQTPPEFLAREGTDGIPPMTPEQSMAQIETGPDVMVELVAAEPLVQDPVAIDFTVDGRLWVVEMHDYAREVDARFPPAGRIKLLADRDGDGRFDHATVFLEKLRFPTDVKAWRQGVLVCDAPDILYAEDRDDDGQADHVEIVFSGFATHNPHARVNSLRYGLDNWLYGSGGLFGGQITTGQAATVDVTDRDFRLQPDTGLIQPVSGRTQQGRCRDDWDNWFGCDNSNLLRHYPVVESYAARNPHVAPPPTVVQVPVGENSQQLFPIGDLVLFKLSGTPGRPTSACGLDIYRDNWLGGQYLGNAFTCEPVNQLVHRRILQRQNATFVGRRAETEQDREFLASRDRWFRPVQVRTGPDGGLWIVDMYRYVIEHPKWIPDETKQRLNLFAGQDRGRIYRVVPVDGRRRPIPRLDQLSRAGLAAAMDTPNGTVRDMVQQLVVWRHDADAADTLHALLKTASLAEVRLQAAYTLQGLGQLNQDDVLRLLADDVVEVRRHGVRLSEAFWNDSPDVLAAVLAADDSDYLMRWQLAQSLGQGQGQQTAQRLSLIASAANDPYLVAAVMSSMNRENLPIVLESMLASLSTVPLNMQSAVVGYAAADGTEEIVARILKQLFRDPSGDARRFRALALVLESASRRQLDLHQHLSSDDHERIEKTIEHARQLIVDVDQPVPLRLAAVQFLATPRAMVLTGKQADTSADAVQLAGLLTAREPPELQEAAINALSRMADPHVAGALLEQWPSVTAQQQNLILDLLISRQDWADTVLDALQSKTLPPNALDATRRQRLLTHADQSLRQRASQVLTEPDDRQRRATIQQWLEIVSEGGDVERGRAVFTKHCANCHRMESAGFEVGPDLAALTTRSPAHLLAAILDPNRDVDARYRSYVVLLDDGRSLSGLLLESTATSVTLREPGGKQHVLLRSHIDELKTTGLSLMPAGFEKDMTPQAAADVIAYLMQHAPRPKQFAGNDPGLVEANQEGHWILDASRAEIYGGDIRFEGPPHHNIGYWHDQHDYLIWQIQVNAAGSYEVWLEYSCDDAVAGNRLQLDLADQRLEQTVPGTGGWDRYRPLQLGSVTLSAGRHHVLLRPASPIRGALLDLRAVQVRAVR